MRETANSPAGPPARGPIGHQPGYARDPLGSLRRWTEAVGDVVPLRFGTQRVLLLTSPAATAEVLEGQADAFRKAPVIRQLAVPVIGHSLFTAEGDAWSRQRALIGPALSSDRVDRHLPGIRQAFEAVTHRWQPVETIDVVDEMMAVSQDISWRVLFGAAASADEISRTRAALAVTSADFEDRLNHPLALLPEWIPTRAHRRLRRAVGELDRLAYGLIDRCRRGVIDGGEVLGALLAAGTTAPWLDARLVRDNVVMLTVEGREDPGLLLAWALYELARRPDVAERMAVEARAVLSDERAVPSADPGRLQLAQAVVRETLRLHPPAYATGRQATRDCAIDGIRVRRGTIVLVSPYVTHRSPTLFRRPELFDPDRWLGDETASLRPGAFAPFGMGPRRRPGESIAWAIGLVGLAVLIGGHRVAPVDPTPVEPVVRLSLRPSREVRLTFTRRT